MALNFTISEKKKEKEKMAPYLQLVDWMGFTDRKWLGHRLVEGDVQSLGLGKFKND